MSRAVLLCILLSLRPAGAQVAPIPPGAKAPPIVRQNSLRWDWRREEELDTQQSIARTKTLPASERTPLLAAITQQLTGAEFQSEDDRTKLRSRFASSTSTSMATERPK